MLTDEQIEGWRMLLLDCNSFYSEQHAEIHALCDQAKAANRNTAIADELDERSNIAGIVLTKIVISGEFAQQIVKALRGEAR